MCAMGGSETGAMNSALALASQYILATMECWVAFLVTVTLLSWRCLVLLVLKQDTMDEVAFEEPHGEL